ncbi:MAG: ABC transporter ATP-binding protein, partial [Clostridia bacterium]|nr:ABC transporter ATP-binding protein [Clostridia bacterium]
MKLMFDLPERDEQAFLAASGADEKRMYCLPYNIEDDRFVSGYMVFTDRCIYKILEGELIETYQLADLTDFACDTLYGSCGFYAKEKGVSRLLCRFISGRNLPRYSVMVKACELLAEGNREPLTNNEPERYCPKCGRPFVVHTKICPFCQDKRETYRKLWAMTKGLRLMMLFPLLAAAIGMIFRFVVPAVQKFAIDRFIEPAIGIKRGSVGEFLLIVAAIVSLDICHRAIDVIKARMAAYSGNKFTLMLRALLFEKIQSLSMSSIQKKSTGDLMGRINNDVSTVQGFLTGQLPNLFSQLFSFVLALIFLLWLNPLMCLFVFVPLPMTVFIICKFWGTVRKRNIHAWMVTNRTNRHLQDILNGIRVVKTYGREEYEIERFEEFTERQAVQDESNAKLFDTVFPLLGFALRLGNYMIMLYGNLRVFAGKMTIGALNQFNSYAAIIYEPLMQITTIPRNISAFTTSLGKVFEILEEEPEVADIGLPLDISIEGDISIRNVTFGYDSYNPVLENINLEVKQGEMIGLVGHSGCGKTTLINLLMRLYDVTEGEILIDDVNIKDISQNALRSQIGVVLQETHLFSGSIRDNIRYSKPHATNAEVIEAARLANAHDFI